MIAVKIECGCGQHYAFEVEPVNGRMPSTVACPTCGLDGTPMANEIISRQVPRPEPVHIIPAEPPPMRVSTPPPPPASATTFAPRSGAQLKVSSGGGEHHAPPPAISSSEAKRLGLVGREQAQVEARAKLSWGDSPEAVTQYLMIQGFSAPEAQEIVAGLYQERLATVRANGVRKIIVGIGLICVPIIGLLFFLHIGIVPMKLMAILVMVGAYGIWQLINGVIALIAPKMESGDVAEQ